MTIEQDVLIKQKMRKLKRNKKRLSQKLHSQVAINKAQHLVIKVQSEILDEKETMIDLKNEQLTERDLEITELKEELRNRPPLPAPEPA